MVFIKFSVRSCYLLLVLWIRMMDCCSDEPAPRPPPPKRKPPPTAKPPPKQKWRTTRAPATVRPGTQDHAQSMVHLAFQRGTTFQIPCADSFTWPPLVVTWYKDGIVIATPSAHYDGGTRKQPPLEILQATDQDAGTYLCSAYNEFGTMNTSREVLITDCNPGLYGQYCENRCGLCLNHVACDTRTGRCHACEKGWTPPLCQGLQNCTFGRYGRLCEHECGQCANNVTCLHTNGYCRACQPGWILPLCQSRGGGGKESEEKQVAIGVAIGAPATLGFIAGVCQIIKCVAGGLPTMPVCHGAEDSDDELVDVDMIAVEQLQKEQLQQQLVQMLSSPQPLSSQLPSSAPDVGPDKSCAEPIVIPMLTQEELKQQQLVTLTTVPLPQHLQPPTTTQEEITSKDSFETALDSAQEEVHPLGFLGLLKHQPPSHHDIVKSNSTASFQ